MFNGKETGNIHLLLDGSDRDRALLLLSHLQAFSQSRLLGSHDRDRLPSCPRAHLYTRPGAE